MEALIACVDDFQHFDIEGKTLLSYTMIQCQKFGLEPKPAATDPSLHSLGSVIPRGSRWLSETVLGCRPRWGSPLIALRGDTFYSDHAIRSLVEAAKSGRLCWIGRQNRSWLSGSSAEIFGFTCPENMFVDLEAACAAAVEHAEASKYPIDRNKTPVGSLWQPYRLMIGNGIDVHGFDLKTWMDVSDFTESFTSADVYKRWKHSRENRWFCQKPLSLGEYDAPPGVGPVG